MLQNLQGNQEIFESYDQVIQEQIAEGAVKFNDEGNFGQQEYYLSHKAVIRENAEITKLQIVCDPSAREKNSITE